MNTSQVPAYTRDQLREAIFEALGAIAPETDFETIKPDRPLRAQIDLDSFDFLNAIIRLHEKIGIDIPEQDYGKLATLNSTIDYLAARLAAASDARLSAKPPEAAPG